MTPFDKNRYKDIANLPEDNRIDYIGNWVINNKSDRTSFVVDVDNEYSKAFDKGDRYIKKLLAKFPQIELKERLPGPVPHIEFIVIGLKKND